ncbi:TonB-dependent receptor [Bacteroides sp.]|uniref:SusC/RagA family TonB-linked outer membrane protein n=1 Tax=Bacteroides sp. TaxID=29523 RepID=UPI00260807A4|nr:TonB-dependent receptor [Bacteroides sp.]MDD3039870.1 TonB-dependent receptor [Bacteroides sp.]
MRKKYILKNTGWLKCPLFCLLLACPISVKAVDSIAIAVHMENAEVLENMQQKVQTRTVFGTIVDNTDNVPIIGATIKIKGTNVGVISDSEGHFEIQVSKGKNTILEISYVGYKTQTVLISDQGEIKIKMESDNEMLDEVVVVGAGIQKKVSVTGAITTIKGSDLRTPTSSLTNNLAGKLAGIIAYTNGGEAGSFAGFYIRGIGSFAGRTTPLILLDGIEISAGDLDRVPSENIESFSLLKDASATAIYGARGANGVLLVTTKSGELNQKAKINVNFEASVQQPMQFVEYVDGARWMEVYNEASIARDGGAVYSQEDIDLTRSHKYPYRYPNMDWQEMMFKDYTWNERANINISGGGARMTYYMSLQVNHDTGMLDIPKTYSYDNNINHWTYIFQNNIAYNLTPTTKIGLKMNAQIYNWKGPSYGVNDLFSAARDTNPTAFPATFPAREGDEHIRFGNNWIVSNNDLYTNPYAKMLSGFKEDNTNSIYNILSIEQDFSFITEGLKATTLVNFNNWSITDYTRSIDPYYYRMVKDTWHVDSPDVYDLERVGTSGTDYINEHDNGYRSGQVFYLDARLDYNRTFGNHNVTGMLMYMQRESRSGVRPNRLQGFSGRFTYDYGHKYLAEFNFGYNGTERLKKGERFEFFPAMSVGWVPNGEDFWEPLQDYVSFLKIRSSYGVVGNDGMDEGAGHFLYVDNVNLNGGGFHTGYDGGYYYVGPNFSTYAVENACWERVNKLNIGVDMELFNQLNLTFDWFYDHRHKIFMRRGSWPILMGYGGATPWSNVGEVDNHGVELTANWRKKIAKDLSMEFRGTFTYNKNRYVYFDEPKYETVWTRKDGLPLSYIWGYVSEGYFTSEDEIKHWPDQTGLGSQPKPGDIKYTDLNGDGIINGSDAITISPYGSMPRIQYGFGVNLAYKKFDFGVFFNGSAQRKIMINEAMTAFGWRNNNVMKCIADDHWSIDNPNANAQFPRLGLRHTDIDNNTQPSTHWLRNGNFIRFKTLELGYTLPHCRIFFSADNLAVWSPFKLWDPELGWNSYPLQRTFNMGVQVNI